MSWILTLFMRFQTIWGIKWANVIPNEDYLNAAKMEWGEALHDLTGEEIAKGIEYSRANLEWPPSIAEFRLICKPNTPAYHKEFPPGLPDDRRLSEENREEFKKLREKIC